MSILGKIFKSKLDQRQFEFKEEYWMALEKKLNAHDGKNAVTRWKRISFYISIVVISAAAFLFFSEKTENSSMLSDSTHEEIITVSAPNQNKNSPDAETIKTENVSVISSKEENNSSVKNEKSFRQETNILISEIKSGKSFSEQTETAGKKEIHDFKMKISHPVSELNSSEETEMITVSENLTVKNEESNVEIFSVYSAEPQNNVNVNISSFSFLQKIILRELPANTPNEMQNPVFPEKKIRKKYHCFTGVYSGIMYSDKILNSSDPSLAQYISRRKNEESAAWTKNFGIDIGIAQKFWSISTGINFHQQSEITEYKPEFYQWLKTPTSSWQITGNSYWQTDTVNSFSITVAEGSWQSANAVSGTDTINVYQYVTYNTYEKDFYITDSTFIQEFDSAEIVKTDSVYQLVNDGSHKPEKTATGISYFEIPLLVGYEIPVSRFSFMLRTGFSVGILSAVHAAYLKKDISGTEEITVARMNKTMLNYLLRAGICYYATEKIIFNVEPMFRMNVNSAVKDANFSQKYLNAGVNAGIMYRF